MTFHDASKEFELDCKVRHLSPKTIDIYGDPYTACALLMTIQKK